MRKVLFFNFILFFAYLLPGKFAYLLALPPDGATPIWPSSGICAAGVILLGYRTLPGVFLGSLVLNLNYNLDLAQFFTPAIFGALPVNSLIAVGALIEAFTVAFVVKRIIGYPNAFDYWKDILILCVVAGIIGAIPSPTIGMTTLSMYGILPWSSFFYNWWAWWIGNSSSIIAFTPIIVTVFAKNSFISRKRKLRIAIPIISVFALVATIFLNASQWENTKLHERFKNMARIHTANFENRFDLYSQQIGALKSFYDSSKFVDFEEFQSFLQDAKGLEEGSCIFEWVPKVKFTDVPKYMQMAKEQGISDFGIRESRDEENLVPVEKREIYFPALYSSSCSEKYNNLGFDYYSDPIMKHYMDKARDQNISIATEIIMLDHVHNEPKALIMFTPVYNQKQDISSVEGRRKNLKGFVTGVFRLDHLLKDFVEKLKADGIELEIHEQNNFNKVEHSIFRSSKEIPKSLLETDLIVDIGEKTWRLHIYQTAEYLVAHKEWHLWYVLMGGLLFTAITMILTLIITGNTESVNKLVKQKTKDLKESEMRFQLVVKGTRDGLWDWTDVDRDQQYWSPQFHSLLGFEEGEIVSSYSKFLELIHPDDLAKVKKAINANSDNEKTFDIEFKAQKKSGKYSWFQGRGINSIDEETGSKRVTGSITDISSRKNTEKKLEKAKDEAEEANRMKSDFLATMSHEIRTPMNGIIGITELLSDTELTQQQKGYTKNILYSAENLLEILNDILDFSKIEAGKMELEQQPFDLRQATEEVVELLSPHAVKKDLKLNLKFDKGAVKFLIGDQMRVRQILHNLVGNAIKFTEKGSVTIKVGLQDSYTPPDGKAMIMISVIDTGIGLTKEQRRAIFNKFVQADSSMSRKFGGTGLGLTISQMLVALFEGEVGVESEPGEGSNFWFTMLLDVTTKKVVETQASAQQTTEATYIPKETIRVLMAEDNRINAEFAKEMLEKLNCEVITARHGREACEILESDRDFALIFMDCQMPVMDGFDATRNIRKYEDSHNYPHIPIIALTANAMKGDRERCLDSGMDDYLTKPVRLRGFSNMMQKWLDK